MERYIEKLRSCQTDESPKSILNMLDDKVKQDFREQSELMNGMPLHAMDEIVYPICILCRDHERSGFIHGVQVGIRLAQELK